MTALTTLTPASSADQPIDTTASVRSLDQAWLAWQERGVVRERRMTRRMTALVIIIGAGLVIWFSMVSLAA